MEEHSGNPGTGLVLSTLDPTKLAEEGVWYQVVHPKTGSEIPGVRLLVYGEDSHYFAKAMNKIADKRAIASRGRRNQQTLNYDDLSESELTLAVYIVGDWDGILDDNGQPLPCSNEVKRAVFDKHRWLAEQALMHMRDRANFIPD